MYISIRSLDYTSGKEENTGILKLSSVNGNTGILKLSYLGNILSNRGDNDYSYQRTQYNFIITLMKKFELAYEIDDRTVLIPQLLDVQEPYFDFNYDNIISFAIDYDFLPKSIISRYLVKMNRDIKDNLQWRTGAVLENKEFNSCAVVKCDHEEKRILIKVGGDQKRDYFSSLLNNLREINDSFENIIPVEKISLPDDPEITVRYNYLITLEKNGIPFFIPDGSTKRYNVDDLLGVVNIRRRENELLEEILNILNKTNGEEKLDEIASLLRNLVRDQAVESDNRESLLRKINKIIYAKPSIMGFGFNINEAVDIAIDQYLNWRISKK